MSKLADQLRAIRVFNNWGLLKKFGTEMDVAIEYHRPAEGRLGWTESSHTSVWSPHQNPKLGKPRRWGQHGTNKEFHGLRRDSLPAALAWAGDVFGQKYVPSPFGGYIPEHVRFKARMAVRRRPAQPPQSKVADA